MWKALRHVARSNVRLLGEVAKANDLELLVRGMFPEATPSLLLSHSSVSRGSLQLPGHSSTHDIL